MWFLCALFSTIAWGCADLFYKKGADENDKYSHLKTSMIVGFIMGGHAIATLLISGIEYNPVNLLNYFPVSAMYILSMTVGYFGLRYLELSISSPIQNSSGAVCCILCLVLLGQTMDILSATAVILICLGVVFLGLLEHLELKKERASLPDKDKAADEKYRIGLVAFLMPILYAVIDALGTFMDAYYLDDYTNTPLVGVTEETIEDVANISYELTFLICAVLILIFLMMNRKNTTAVVLKEGTTKARIFAAVFETAGQATYVYAMSGNGVVAAPMIASYSIVSLLLSRIFLKEKLSKWQYIAVTIVIIGIGLLGVVEGLAE